MQTLVVIAECVFVPTVAKRLGKSAGHGNRMKSYLDTNKTRSAKIEIFLQNYLRRGLLAERIFALPGKSRFDSPPKTVAESN